MNKEKSNDRFEEVCRFAVIRQYLGLVGKVIYDHNSWNMVQQRLEKDRLQQKRKQTLQTLAMMIVTVFLTICIFLQL